MTISLLQRGRATLAKTRWGAKVRWRRLPWVALLIVAGLSIMALFADQLAPHDPLETNLRYRLMPPAFAGGTWQYPLGTDDAGRCLLSRIIYGARLSLIVAIVTVILGAALGSLIGIVAGYRGGKLDTMLMRATDFGLSFPIVLLALLLAVVFGPKPANVVIAIALTLWARFARVVRSLVVSLRAREFVLAAHAAGVSRPRILFRHILPNLGDTIIVLATANLGIVILTEATLSFLGAGIPPPQPAWGSMVAEGRNYVVSAWWFSAMPGVAISLAVVSANLLGDWLRDALDPGLRNL